MKPGPRLTKAQRFALREATMQPILGQRPWATLSGFHVRTRNSLIRRGLLEILVRGRHIFYRASPAGRAATNA